MLSIHNNLSAGAQNVTGATGAYVIIMLVYRRLLTTRLHDKAAVIANNARKTQKLFVQGYNLEVHGVIKYTRYRYHVQAKLLCDVISRSRYRLSSPSVRFAPY